MCCYSEKLLIVVCSTSSLTPGDVKFHIFKSPPQTLHSWAPVLHLILHNCYGCSLIGIPPFGVCVHLRTILQQENKLLSTVCLL